MVIKNKQYDVLANLAHIGDSGVKCGGIIYNSDKSKVLMVMNRLSRINREFKWGFPKGHKKIGEDNIDCAMREIYEETGIQYSKEMLQERKHLYGNIYFQLSLPSENENQDIFLANDTKEVYEAKFIPVDELRNLNVNRDVRRFLQTTK